MMALTSVFGGMGTAPSSLHDLASGLHDDTVPWIIEDDDDNTAPALTTADYCSDFFWEVTVGNLQQEMAHEKATVATSPVCSGNGDEPWPQRIKRKVQSECSASQDQVSKRYDICDAVYVNGSWSIYLMVKLVIFRILTMSPAHC